MVPPQPHIRSVPASARLGLWGWIAIVAIFGFLVASIAYAVYGWNSMGSVPIPAMGWVVLAAGIVVTLAVGGGLMALLFYSSRKQYDTAAHGIQEEWSGDRDS